MNEIKESSLILLIIDQFLNCNTTTTTTANEQFTNTDNLTHMLKFIPFTSIFNLPIYTVQERDLIKICHQLHIRNYILTPVYKAATNMIYVCKQNEINEKVTEYMKQTKAYRMIHHFNENNVNNVQVFLRRLCERVKEQLDVVLSNVHSIDLIQYILCNVNLSNVQQFDQLCFLPDLRQYDIPVQPMLISYCVPLANMTRYLYDLIAPIYYGQTIHQRTLFQGNDAIDAIELYDRQGRLRPTTFFATIKIQNLSTILSTTQTMTVLQDFLNDYSQSGGTAMQGLSVEAILKLVHLVLSHQYFIYQDKLYQQVKGGPSNLPLTHLLADIYLFYWQKQLLSYLDQQKEIFGRCFDEIFLTWNQSKGEFIDLINTISHHQHHLSSSMTGPVRRYCSSSSTFPFKLISTIGNSIDYMDVTISHFNAQLQTKVFHLSPYEFNSLRSMKTTTDQQSNPYLICLRAAFLRAVQYCTYLHDFETEFNFIRLSLLLNHCSAIDIGKSWKVFEKEFKLTKNSFRCSQRDYHKCRERIRNSTSNNQTTFN